eukprot:143731_1
MASLLSPYKDNTVVPVMYVICSILVQCFCNILCCIDCGLWIVDSSILSSLVVDCGLYNLVMDIEELCMCFQMLYLVRMYCCFNILVCIRYRWRYMLRLCLVSDSYTLSAKRS